MRVKRAYKTELKPNRTQEKALANHAGASRFAYNWGLARKSESYRLTGKSPNAIELHRELNALKKTEYPWLYESSKCAPQEALRDLDRAFGSFYRRVALKKRGKLKGKVGYPRFKSRRRGLGSFRLTGAIHVGERRVKLPCLGWIRLKEKDYLPVDGADGIHVLSATVSERAGRWFVSLQVEEDKPEPEPASGPPVGIDLGIKTLATCSYGNDNYTHYENPRALMCGTRKLRKLQKKLSRQEKGSNRREKTRKKIARQHMRITRVRQDAVHKATSQIVAKAKPPSSRPYVIGIEDLNVSGMMGNHSLARAVADASMRESGAPSHRYNGIRTPLHPHRPRSAPSKYSKSTSSVARLAGAAHRRSRCVTVLMRRDTGRQLAYKCSWYGIQLVVVPRFEATSKPCSKCGWVCEDLTLYDRTFCCEACGHTADRDDNASENIRLLAVSSTERVNVRGGDVRPLDSERRTPGKRKSEMAHLSSF